MVGVGAFDDPLCALFVYFAMLSREEEFVGPYVPPNSVIYL